MMRITTESGAIYLAEVRETKKGYRAIFATKGEDKPTLVAGIFPNRLKFFEASVKFQEDGHRVLGLNKYSKVTIKFIPDKIELGMILVSKNGLRSTKIVKIE